MELLKVHNVDSEGLEPQVIVKVPGISRYVGSFADSSNGVAFCSTNGLALYIALSKRTDGVVYCTNCLTGEHRKFQLGAIKYKKEDRWSNYIKGVLDSTFPQIKNFQGMTVTLEGTILQSNNDMVRSAITVGMLHAVNRLFKLGMEQDKLEQLAFNVFTSFCIETVPYINVLAMMNLKQNTFAVIDTEHAQCTVLENTFKPASSKKNADGYTILIADGKIPVAPMREELGKIKESLDKAMDNFRTSLRKSGFRNMDASEINEDDNGLTSENRRLCLYLYDEYKCASQIEGFITNKDAEGLGRCFNKIQKGFRENLELVCPEIDWLVKRATEMSTCTGACMVSNGLGGAVALVINNSEYEAFSTKLQDYERIFGFKSHVYPLECSNKLQFLSTDNACFK